MLKEMTDWLFRFGMGIVPVVAAVVLTGFAKPPTVLEQVIRSGELVVVTRVGPTTFYQDAQGPAGFEYDLARMFADELGVDLRIVTPEDPADIVPMVARREAHLAAPGVGIRADRLRHVRFGPSYHEATQQVVYRRGIDQPRGPADLVGASVAGSGHVTHFDELFAAFPEVDWRPEHGLAPDDLLARLWQKEIRYLVTDSNQIKISRRYYPELRVAFDLTDPAPLAWIFPKGRDDSLLRAAEAFFGRIDDNGQLAWLRERYYGHVGEFDYVGVRRFLRHVDQRLPEYVDVFREAAERNGIDWRLLAAIGYQESHWNPKAVSPTGVRGIMMLTIRTAAELGIKNRIDPGNSIRGGARYLRRILDRLPANIPEPDRTWFALAAYNVGLGHLEDARAITARRGGNPDRWMDVMESLPLLMQKQWYKDTRYGYARGREAVQYVQNIRSYYDILVWQNKPRGPASTTTVAATDRPSAESLALGIPSPVL